MTTVAAPCRPLFGGLGFVCGTIALIMVLLQFGVGPLAPKQGTGSNFRVIAAQINQSAQRKLSGLPAPAPKAAPWNIDRIVKVVAIALGGLAVILGAVGLLRRETPYFAIAAIAFAIGVFLVPLSIWLTLLIVGGALLMVIIRQLDVTLGN